MPPWISFAVIVVLASCGHLTNAEIGVLTFWNDANFTGQKLQIHRSLMGQYCYNDYVRQPSSISWQNLPTTGLFDGKSKIAFYKESDCKGIVRAWFTTERDFPTNLALDGINDNVQSFMLWQISQEPRVYVHPD